MVNLKLDEIAQNIMWNSECEVCISGYDDIRQISYDLRLKDLSEINSMIKSKIYPFGHDMIVNMLLVTRVSEDNRIILNLLGNIKERE